MTKLAAIKSIALGKTYELSLVKGYVAKWGMAQAIRELIQNALDSESPFVYEFYRQEHGIWSLRLSSEFTTLAPKTLLLGATSKADADDQIGSFGEGYKIALLVLTREGYDVEMLNGNLTWRPRFRMSRTFGQEVLVIDEIYTEEKGNSGLTFLVHGLTDDDVEQIRSSCLRMQDSIGAIKTTQYGEILLDQAGMLYVGSLFICKTELTYGYNIKPKYINLERDRQTVDSYDLKDTALKMWYDTKEFERIAQMIAESVPDVEYSRYSSPEIVKEECYKIFIKNNPGAIIAESPQDLKNKIESGMTKVVFLGDGMYHAVSKSPSYRATGSIVERKNAPPHEVLSKFLTDHRNEMRTPAIVAFKALIADAKIRWVNK